VEIESTELALAFPLLTKDNVASQVSRCIESVDGAKIVKIS